MTAGWEFYAYVVFTLSYYLFRLAPITPEHDRRFGRNATLSYIAGISKIYGRHEKRRSLPETVPSKRQFFVTACHGVGERPFRKRRLSTDVLRTLHVCSRRDISVLSAWQGRPRQGGKQ